MATTELAGAKGNSYAVNIERIIELRDDVRSLNAARHLFHKDFFDSACAKNFLTAMTLKNYLRTADRYHAQGKERQCALTLDVAAKHQKNLWYDFKDDQTKSSMIPKICIPVRSMLTNLLEKPVPDTGGNWLTCQRSSR